jgi:hypothetical protein
MTDRILLRARCQFVSLHTPPEVRIRRRAMLSVAQTATIAKTVSLGGEIAQPLETGPAVFS